MTSPFSPPNMVSVCSLLLPYSCPDVIAIPSRWRVKSICGIPRLSRLYHICVKKREMFQSLHSLLCTNMPRQQHNSTTVNFLDFPCLESDYFCMRPQSLLSDYASILRSLSNKHQTLDGVRVFIVFIQTFVCVYTHTNYLEGVNISCSEI